MKKLLLVLVLLQLTPTSVVPYDIVYVKAPRFGDTTNSHWPEVFNPVTFDAGADLILLHPDGSEEVLVKANDGAITDPAISFDAQYCFYSFVPNVKLLSARGLPLSGSDIWKINLTTKIKTQLTHGERTPNTGAQSSLEGNVFNTGPTPIPGNRIAFTSNRNLFAPNKNFTTVNFQLYVMDNDGENVFAIAPMSLGSALHPSMLKDGRLSFSSYEAQGLRDERMWGLWSVYPDGRHFEPLMSAFHYAQALHFSTQKSDESIVITDYYNANNNGFGAFYSFPASPPKIGISGTGPQFNSAFEKDNPRLTYSNPEGKNLSIWIPFSPKGIVSTTPWTSSSDQASYKGADGIWTGKVTQPSSAPNNDLLLVWTPGPANQLTRPTNIPVVDGGLYIYKGGGNIIPNYTDLVLIKNDPKFNEMWPRAVVTYKSIYGVDEPVDKGWLPNDGSLNNVLPAGTPYGIIGTSSFIKRESKPGVDILGSFDGWDGFYAGPAYSTNWTSQGSDAGKYSPADINSVRIVTLEPRTARYTNTNLNEFFNFATERMRILGEVNLRWTKPDGNPILDADGNPDTSFWARIPADTPFTFQMLDKNKHVLTTAQTWHQVRPGEVRVDCGGCHAHSQMPTAFEGSAASKSVPVDLTSTKPIDVEFLRDIRPLLTRSCVSCHKGTNAPSKLQLDDLTPISNLPGDYYRLAYDSTAKFGYKPLSGTTGEWGGLNATRYVRKFQSRRSLLIWKIYGQRLDGWINSDHPTEINHDPTTFPPNINPAHGDIDYTGDAMLGSPPLSDLEKLTFARWVDLGCPIDILPPLGWFLDDLRPTLTISSPRPNLNTTVPILRVAFVDYNSGIDVSTLSITSDIIIGGRAPGSNLVSLGTINDNIWTANVAVSTVNSSHLTAQISDKQGNKTTQTIRFTSGQLPPPTTNDILKAEINALLDQIRFKVALIK